MTGDGGTFDGATLTEGGGSIDGQLAYVPCLTMAYHPDPARIGDQLRLNELVLGRKVVLGRLEPRWSTAIGGRGQALNDPFVSRKPIEFRGVDGGVAVDPANAGTAVTINGVLARGETRLSANDLGLGVVIELGGRIVMVLHWARPQPDVQHHLGLLGVSAAISDVRREIRRVAPEPVPVLLRGASGTGKELVARALHNQSRRAGPRFVAVNMGAIPPTTAASELFGHMKGAFTGAATSQPGYFGEADSGTLFLDEIGETPPSIQPILLRALENGEIQPLGSQRPRKVDVRIIAATDSDLEKAIDENSFRVALLHRLAGYEIRIAPLQARREDVGLLFMHFFAGEVERLGMGDKLTPKPAEKKLWLPAELMARLVSYHWPGNVRQLRNVARQLAIASKGENRVVINGAVASLLPETQAEIGTPGTSIPESVSSSEIRGKRANLDDISDEQLVEVLRENQWKIAATARALEVSKNSLYQLMDRCALIRKAKDLTREEIEESMGSSDGNTADAATLLQVSQRGLKLRMTELGMS